MWRNMVETTGGKPILGTPFVGLLAEQILAETAMGTHGPGLLYNDGLVTGKRYRLALQGAFGSDGVVYENGSFSVTAPASTSYLLYEDNVLVGSTPTTVGVGVPVTTVTGAVAVTAGIGGTAAASGAVTSAPTPGAPDYPSVSLESVLPYVHDELPAVPYLVAMRAVADATREFCTLSTAWRGTTPAVTTVPAQAEYALALPDSGQLVGLHMVTLNGRELRVYGESQAPRVARQASTQGHPAAATPVRGTALRLHPAPASPGTLVAEVSMRPRLGATQAPEFLVSQYARELGTGAKMLLARQRNTPWFSRDAAEDFAGVFYAGASAARREVEGGFMGAESAVEIPKWV